MPDIPSDIIKKDDNTTPYDIYIVSGKERPQLKRYSHACDAVYLPVIRPEPHDMGTNDEPDMSGSSEDSGGEGCSSAGASAPAALLWLLAPLAPLRKRRRDRS
jgi:Synergist-CTERM protein sorting domain-containing protein